MERFEIEDGKLKGPERRPWARYLVFAALVLSGAGISLAFGPELPGSFSETASILVQAAKNTIFPGSYAPPDLEIPLDTRGDTAALDLPKENSENKPEREIQENASTDSLLRGEGNPAAASEKASQATVQGASPEKEEEAKAGMKSFSAPVPDCDFLQGGAPKQDVIFNEIAWMGSPAESGETASAASNNEWIELKNVFQKSVSLSGWKILDADGKLEIIFGEGEHIGAGELYLLERTDDGSVRAVAADDIYTGGLSNGGEWIKLFDAACALVDEVNAPSGWPAGENSAKKTMERGKNKLNWHTSVSPGGTPRAENSDPLLPASGASSQAQQLPRHTVSVSIQGSGSGIVTSTPSGIHCGFDCSEEYSEGTEISLSATPNSDSRFDGWISGCSGTGLCSISVTGSISIVAALTSTASPSGSPGGVAAGDAQNEPGYPVIAEVQIAGSATNEDFIKIYNPGSLPLDISGWQLKKRTSGTTEASIRQFPQGNSIPANGYFMWANSQNGFSESAGANASSTQTLAANNSIALFDAADGIVDAVAWGSGHANPFVEGSPYPVNPGSGQVLKRRFSGSSAQDTQDNVADFEVQ